MGGARVVGVVDRVGEVPDAGDDAAAVHVDLDEPIVEAADADDVPLRARRLEQRAHALAGRLGALERVGLGRGR